jgi:hypothetical protein
VSLLNRPNDGLVSVLVALRNGLHTYGPMSDDELLELVCPSTLGSKDMAKNTLSRWKQLGAFGVDEKGRTTPGPRIASLSIEDIDAFRTAILECVLEPENNPNLVGRQDDEQEASKASDLTRALGWALAQDPYTFPNNWPGVESLQNEQGVIPRILVNDTRWHGLVEWGLFLGFCVPHQRVGVVLNPAFAIRAVTPRIISSSECAAADFISEISLALPVLDGGTYRRVVEGQIARSWRTVMPHELSPSLSLALLTLEAEGLFQMEMRSDAPLYVLLGRGGREMRSVSHIVLGEGG